MIIGRAMSCKPEILIFDEPTKGIDVGTKAEIYRLMKKIAQERQVGIILISSEMNELRKCANRIISLYNGRKAGRTPERCGGTGDSESNPGAWVRRRYICREKINTEQGIFWLG